MIIFLISAVIGFSCLILWDVVWIFWTIGVLLILGGFAIGTDERKRDGRFRTGYKNNAEDQSDIGLAAKLIGIGTLVCILAYYSRDTAEWVRDQYSLIQAWFTRNFWWTTLAIAFVAAILAFMAIKSYFSRVKHGFTIQRLREELDRKTTNELEDLQQKSKVSDAKD